MRVMKQKKGQFIIIAAMLIAIMMISVSTIMYGAMAYYKHERWEEYLAIIDNVELGSRRVVELSLADYTWNNCTNNAILRDTLNQWVNDTKKAYAGLGVTISYNEDDLANEWYDENGSFSAANATITIDITSVGLKGYKFTTPVSLKMIILDTIWNSSEQNFAISLTVDKEDLKPVTNLRESNFLINILVNDQWELWDFTLYYYDEADSFVYKVICENVSIQPSNVSVTVIDTRSIKVIANSTVT